MTGIDIGTISEVVALVVIVASGYLGVKLKKIKKVAKQIRQIYNDYKQAKADGKITEEEMEKIIDDIGNLVEML